MVVLIIIIVIYLLIAAPEILGIIAIVLVSFFEMILRLFGKSFDDKTKK